VILVGNEGPDGPATSLSSDSKPIRLDAFGAGSHTITAIVDDVNRIQESDETNNQLSETIAFG
jgi:subtilase family serine protease